MGVFGNDYPTHDGTGVRDYIHVVDLANGHVAPLKAIENKCGVGIYNMGTGHGYSVLDMVNAFVMVNGVETHYSIMPRCIVDIATCYCDPAKVKAALGGRLSMVLRKWLDIVEVAEVESGRVYNLKSLSIE